MIFALKKIFLYFGLHESSIVLGYIVLVLKMIWMGLRIADIIIITPYVLSNTYQNSDLPVGYSLVIMHLLTLVLQTIFVCVMLAGLITKNRSYLRAYRPSVVCYIIEIVVFAITTWFVGVYWKEVYFVIIFSSDILTKLITICFLLTVRNRYLYSEDSKHSAIIYKTKTDDFQDNMIII